MGKVLDCIVMRGNEAERAAVSPVVVAVVGYVVANRFVLGMAGSAVALIPQRRMLDRRGRQSQS